MNDIFDVEKGIIRHKFVINVRDKKFQVSFMGSKIMAESIYFSSCQKSISYASFIYTYKYPLDFELSGYASIIYSINFYKIKNIYICHDKILYTDINLL